RRKLAQQHPQLRWPRGVEGKIGGAARRGGRVDHLDALRPRAKDGLQGAVVASAGGSRCPSPIVASATADRQRDEQPRPRSEGNLHPARGLANTRASILRLAAPTRLERGEMPVHGPQGVSVGAKLRTVVELVVPRVAADVEVAAVEQMHELETISVTPVDL